MAHVVSDDERKWSRRASEGDGTLTVNQSAVITVLVEDSARRRGFRGEHGLSLLVEYADERILFDTGQSNLFVENAQQAGVSLSGLTAIVLSHGHYDHGGGLPALEGLLDGVAIYAHPAALSEKYDQKGARRRQIGLSLDKERLEALGARFILGTEPTRLPGGAWLTGEIPRVHPRDQNLVGRVPVATTERSSATALQAMERPIEDLPDPLIDDQALVLPTMAGLVIVVGCAHAGLLNTIEAACALAGADDIRAVIGGFHLFASSDDDIRATIERLEQYDIDLLAPCHCTGRRGQVDLLRAFPGRVQCPSAGDRIILG